MLELYNTLTRKKEVFKPIKAGKVGMYSCGPTVYNYAHIGNLRTYITNDILRRILEYNKFKVTHAMNMTDVDDKTIKASQSEGTSLKELTRKYESIFLGDLKQLNILIPNKILRATESIPEILDLVDKLVKKKYAYSSSDGIYFSIDKFKPYGQLAQLDKIKKTKERIKKDEYDKSNPQDFALWKFYSEEDGPVAWDTKLGKGRPGWHIECSAMSMKALGKHFDIHTGAIDLIFPHHTNEIAQSEAATGKKFVNYWVHPGFLALNEGKMAKSIGNVIYLRNLIEQGFKPEHFRYLCLQSHYRSLLNFSFDNLDASKTAFERLKNKIIELKKNPINGNDKTKEYEQIFLNSINDDLNTPAALQVVWKVLDDFDFDSKKKLKLLEKFDTVLGLGIKEMKEEKVNIPNDVKKLIEAREKLRKDKKWAEADIYRDRIKESGFLVKDTPDGPKLEKI